MADVQYVTSVRGKSPIVVTGGTAPVVSVDASFGLGTVTHTLGAMTAGNFVLGNGAADIKDAGFSIVPIASGGTGSNQFQVVKSTPFTYDTAISNGYYAFSSFKFSDSYAGAVLSAGSFISGNGYRIVSVGSTDFTAIGASSNTIGVVFTATGAGSGSGTATALGFINGLTIEQRLSSSAINYGRQTIMGLCYQTVAGTMEAAFGNFTGVVGEATTTSGNGGSAGTPNGAYFGLNGIASASGSAQYVELVSGGEFNTYVYVHGTPNTRARRHNGINIAPNIHSERGYVVDTGINIYEQSGSGGTWRHGILFGCVGASSTTFAAGTDPASGGTGSAVLAAYGAESVNYVLDLRNFTASVAFIKGTNLTITDTAISGLTSVTATTFSGDLSGTIGGLSVGNANTNIPRNNSTLNTNLYANYSDFAISRPGDGGTATASHMYLYWNTGGGANNLEMWVDTTRIAVFHYNGAGSPATIANS